MAPCWWCTAAPSSTSSSCATTSRGFADNSLQHSQPFWYYLPVLLGGLFPWSVLLSLVARPVLARASPPAGGGHLRRRVFLFFSLSTNKLPGYILPLMPAACLMMALALDSAVQARRSLALTALLLGLCPVIATILPGRAAVRASPG